MVTPPPHTSHHQTQLKLEAATATGTTNPSHWKVIVISRNIKMYGEVCSLMNHCTIKTLKSTKSAIGAFYNYNYFWPKKSPQVRFSGGRHNRLPSVWRRVYHYEYQRYNLLDWRQSVCPLLYSLNIFLPTKCLTFHFYQKAMTIQKRGVQLYCYWQLCYIWTRLGQTQSMIQILPVV